MIRCSESVTYSSRLHVPRLRVSHSAHLQSIVIVLCFNCRYRRVCAHFLEIKWLLIKNGLCSLTRAMTLAPMKTSSSRFVYCASFALSTLPCAFNRRSDVEVDLEASSHVVLLLVVSTFQELTALM